MFLEIIGQKKSWSEKTRIEYLNLANYFLAAASIAASTALFLAICPVADSAERLPVSIFRPNFKNWTSKREVVLFFLSFLFKRVTPMVLNLIF
mgnify:CR=1 FL=1